MTSKTYGGSVVSARGNPSVNGSKYYQPMSYSFNDSPVTKMRNRLKKCCYYVVFNISTESILFMSHSEGDCFKYLNEETRPDRVILRWYTSEDLSDCVNVPYHQLSVNLNNYSSEGVHE